MPFVLKVLQSAEQNLVLSRLLILFLLSYHAIDDGIFALDSQMT